MLLWGPPGSSGSLVQSLVPRASRPGLKWRQVGGGGQGWRTGCQHMGGEVQTYGRRGAYSRPRVGAHKELSWA